MKIPFRQFTAVTYIQFVKFGIVGLSNTVISYAIYSLLVYVKVYYIIASIMAFVISVTNAFFWNKRYVFKGNNNRQSVLKSLVRTFIAYSLTGLILQNGMLFLLIDIFLFSKYLAPFLCLIVTVPLNFFLNKFWAFRL